MIFLAALVDKSVGDVSYLTFTAASNPKNSTITLTVTSSSVSSVYQVYTIEFWMRPLIKVSSSSAYLVMKNSNDWSINYSYQDNSITVLSSTGLEYCYIYPIFSYTWLHLALSYDYMNEIFYCYLNGTLTSSKSITAIAKYPNSLILGNNFYGNIYQLRAWVGILRTSNEIAQYYNTLYNPPYPSSLVRLWSLAKETTTNRITDAIDGKVAKISSKFIDVWLTESPGSNLLCGTGFFGSNGICTKCSEVCSFCKAADQCMQTKRNYLDFSRAGNDGSTISLGSCASSQIGTIEFWFKPNSWSGSSAELLKINNYLKIAQRASGDVISFYDGNGLETVTQQAPQGIWMHVAWVYKAGSVQIYLNSTVKTTTWANTTSSILYLGGTSADIRFNGIISDLRLWTSARTSGQILSNLYSNFSTISSDIYHFFPLNNTGITIASTDLKSTTSSSIIASLWRTTNCTNEPCLFQCPPSYYPSTSGDCFKCDISCLSCSGSLPSNCTLCPDSSFTIAGLNNCYSICPSGYVAFGKNCITSCPDTYFNNSGTCSQCISPCVNCINATYCTTCETGYLLYPNKITDRCVKLCPTGQYRDITNNCQNCNSICTECIGNSISDCTKCKSTEFLYKGTCISTCATSTYTIGNSCFDCDISCFSCTGSLNSQCIQCASSYPYKDLNGICYKNCPLYVLGNSNTCVDICPSSSYAMLNLTCKDCDPSCLECSGPTSTDCIACAKYYYLGKCYSTCPSGTFTNLTNCAKCDISCTECTTTSKTCTSCSASYPYNSGNTCYSKCPVYTFLPNKCVEKCPIGFIPINNTCTACDLTCTDCSLSTSHCTLCESDLNLFNNTCIESCPFGYYSSEGICFACLSPCSSCESTQDFCLSCKDPSLYLDIVKGKCNSTCISPSYFFNQTCVSSCPDSYYSNEYRNCLKCSEGCEVCNELSNCLQCSHSFYTKGTYCASSCGSKFYPIDSNMTCGTCNEECQECIGKEIENCTVCSGGKLVYVDMNGVGKCLSSCPDGTYQNSTMCKNCKSTCKTCSSGEICNSCKQGFFMRNSGNCVSDCDVGEIGVNATCVKYLNFSPVGTVEVESLPVFQVTYPMMVTAGNANINIYSVVKNSYTKVLSVLAKTTTYSIGNSLCLVLKGTDLRYGTNYTIEYTNSSILNANNGNTQIPPGIFFFNTNPYILKPLIVILNNGTAAFQVKKTKTFFLNASSSFDPSEFYRTSELKKSWNCEDYSTSFSQFSSKSTDYLLDYISQVTNYPPSSSLCSVWNYLIPPSDFIFEINGFSQIGLLLKFTFTLSDSERSTSKSLYVQVVSDENEPVSIENLPLYKVNTDKVLQLYVKNPIWTNPNGYIWNCLSSGQTPNFLTPISGSWALSIGENSLTQGTLYQFSITYSDTVTKSSSVIQILTNTPAQSGVLFVDKFIGMALTDTFSFAMLGWVDDDLPLTYAFALKFSEKVMMLSARQTSTQVNMIFSDGSFQVVGYCFDAFGAASESIANVTVTSMRSLENIIIGISQLPSTLNSNNALIVLAYISAFAAELNWGYSSALQEVLVQKKLLLDYVVEINGIAQQLQSLKDHNFLYIYSSILSSADLILLGASDETLANSILALIDSIDYSVFNTTQILIFQETNISVSSPQTVLSPNQLLKISSVLSSILQSLSKYPKNYASSITSLIGKISKVLGTGSILFEKSRSLNTSGLVIQSSKSLISGFENTIIFLNSSSIQIPSLNQLNLSSVSVISGHSQKNPFTSNMTSLQQYLFMTIGSVDDSEDFEVMDLADPFILSFNISRAELGEIDKNIKLASGTSDSYLPQCAYWDFNTSQWRSDGCIVYNIADLFYYFDSKKIPDSLNVQCACNHLSYFTITFEMSLNFAQTTYIIHDEELNEFDMKTWHHGISIIIMIIGFIVFAGLLIYGCFFDGKIDDFILCEENLDYWDLKKGEFFLKRLDRKHMELLSDQGDIRGSIYKVLNSQLYKHFSKTADEIEASKNQEIIEVKTGNFKAKNNSKINEKIEKYLSSPEAESKLKFVDRKAHIEAIKVKYLPMLRKAEMEHEETENYVEPERNIFSNKMIIKDLTPSQLLRLGVNPSEFHGLKPTKFNQFGVFPGQISGGNYCKFYLGLNLTTEANNYCKSTKIPYWSIFSLYLKKEHKFLGIFFPFHSEFSKKQVISLAFTYWLLQLLLCQLSITYLNWEFPKVVSNSKYCVWGCRYESQLIQGVICAILPWPLICICKSLLVKSVLNINSSHHEK